MSSIVNSAPADLTISRLCWLVGIGTLSGAEFGTLTNIVNGTLCPQYFRDVMQWYGGDIWLSASRQGAFEGALYGFSYSIVFVLLLTVMFRRQCRFQTAKRLVGLTFVLAFCFWVLGGSVAVWFAWCYPILCDPLYFGEGRAWPAFGYYAWVRGSIWGVIFGGLCSVFLTMTIYSIRSRRLDMLNSRIISEKPLT